MASYWSLPKYPTVYTVIARMPESGPIPISITKNIAQMILGRLLKTERINLDEKDSQPGFRFRAAEGRGGKREPSQRQSKQTLF